MSTNINITVDSSSLTLAVKLLQEAARNAQLQKESDKKLEDDASKAAEAEKARRAKSSQNSSGGNLGTGIPGGGANVSNQRDAKGNPIFGSKIEIPTIDRRPAASRRGKPLDVGHVWIYETEVVASGQITGIPQLGTYTGEEAVGYVTANSVSEQKALIGCGNGDNWEQFNLRSGQSFFLAPGTMADVPLEPGSTTKTWGTGVKDYAHQYLVLPTGGSNFILTVINAYSFNSRTTTGQIYRTDEFILSVAPIVGNEYYGGTSTTAVGEVTYTSFVVNNQSIREIDTPPALKDILGIVSYTIENRSNTVLVWGPSVFETISTKVIEPGTSGGLFMFGDLSFDNRLKLYSSFSDRTSTGGHSPKVFYDLNQASQYTNEAKTLPPPRHKAILADGRTGIYKRFREDNEGDGQTIYSPTDSFKYLRWYNANETPSLEVWEEGYTGTKPNNSPKFELKLSDDRETNPFGYDLTSPIQVPSENIIVVTDWGDPGYCRKMCKALGFADADLQPTLPAP